MGLKHLTLRVEQVEVSDSEHFAVRGLDLVDISKLVDLHRDELVALFSQVQAGGMSDAMLADPSALVSVLFNVAPTAAIQIIGLAADEDDLDLVRLLTFSVQLDAIEKIARLTFATQSPGKVLE